MKFLFTLPTVVLFLYSFSSQLAVSEANGCKRIAQGDIPIPLCRNYGYVVVGNKPIYRNQFDVIILFNEKLQTVGYFCHGYDRILNWTRTGKYANKIRASYIADELKLQVYWCDDLCGPKKPENCAFQTFSVACPGLSTSDHVCVYEMKTTKVSTHTTVDAIEVTGTVAANVMKKIAGVSVSTLRKNTKVTTVTYSSKSYIVVPSGYRFCSYKEAKAVKDALAPTGYKWQCYPPTYRQDMTTGKCTPLPICTDVDCSNCKKPTTSGSEVISPFYVSMLILTAAVIVICF